MALRITVAGSENWNEISNISEMSGYMDYINRIGPSYLDVGTVLMAYVDDDPAGFLKIEEMDDDSVWLSGIRVLPKFRRMHVGSALTNGAMEIARRKSFRMARLLTHRDNYNSISMVQKAQFSKVCEMAFFRGISVDGMKTVQSLNQIPKLLNLGWKFSEPLDSLIDNATIFRSDKGAEVVEIENSFQITRWASDLEFTKEGFSCMEIYSKLPETARKYMLDDFDIGLIFEKNIE
ncbi:MAG: GNAT family N-acetyltransferase [Thermoplasmataceae archaeon]|jgi:GNAT superfamily N-acetyltransferase